MSSVKTMPSIPHFDQMTPREHAKLFEGNTNNLTFSEKFDGSNVSFGIDDYNQIYVKSKKGKPITNPKDYYTMARSYNNDIFAGFGSLLETLQTTLYKAGVHKSLFAGDIQIFGEMFSKKRMNVVDYSYNSNISDKTVVIFGITENGKDIFYTRHGRFHIELFINAMKDNKIWKFITIRNYTLPISNEPYVYSDAETLQILTSRKKQDSNLRAKKTASFYDYLATEKKGWLNYAKEKGLFGLRDFEGLIIKNTQNGAMAKIVDLEDFGKRRVEQWAGVDLIKKQKKQFFLTILQKALKNADIFVMEDKMYQKLDEIVETKGLFNNKNEILTIFYEDAKIDQYSYISYPELIKLAREYQAELLKVTADPSLSPTAKAEAINAVYAEIHQTNNFFVSTSESFSYENIIEYILGVATVRELENLYCRKP